MFANLTLGQIAEGIAVIGVIFGFLFKVFTLFSKVRENEAKIKELQAAIEAQKKANEQQEKELVGKVEETNSAVNLLCMGLSALIDHELNENSNKDELRSIKQRLDEKKEIV